MSSKARKHKQMVKKMTAERNEQENRTNSMINQLNEQMSLLQKMAMERMEVRRDVSYLIAGCKFTPNFQW